MSEREMGNIRCAAAVHSTKPQQPHSRLLPRKNNFSFSVLPQCSRLEMSFSHAKSQKNLPFSVVVVAWSPPPSTKPTG